MASAALGSPDTLPLGVGHWGLWELGVLILGFYMLWAALEALSWNSGLWKHEDMEETGVLNVLYIHAVPSGAFYLGSL